MDIKIETEIFKNHDLKVFHVTSRTTDKKCLFVPVSLKNMQERKAIGKEEGKGDRVIFFKRNNEASPEIILDATFSSFPIPPKRLRNDQGKQDCRKVKDVTN